MVDPYALYTYPGLCASCNASRDLCHNLVCDHDYCVECLERFLRENQFTCQHCSKNLFEEYLDAESTVLGPWIESIRQIAESKFSPEKTVESMAKLQVVILLSLSFLGGAMAPTKCTEHRREKIQITGQKFLNPQST